MKSNKVLVTTKGQKFFFKGEDLHTQFGYVKKEDIKKAKPGTKVKTHKGKELIVYTSKFSDLFEKIKHGAQTIPIKDVGFIVAETGLQPDWKIVDSGSGTGALCCMLANLVPKGKVNTYELREDHLKIVKHNIKHLNLKNIEIKQHDIYKGIPKKNLDLITLDLPEPWEVISHAAASLKPGGFLVSYSPCIPQVSDFVDAVKQNKKFIYLKTVEIIEREWEIDKRRIRPKTSSRIGHSGFISFVRKV